MGVFGCLCIAVHRHPLQQEGISAECQTPSYDGLCFMSMGPRGPAWGWPCTGEGWGLVQGPPYPEQTDRQTWTFLAGSVWNEKSTAQTSLFGSCWEIWIKEQPVTYLYPVSMILIKTLWRSGGLPVLMESKVSSSFLYMIARNQLLHNVAILRESGFNFKLSMANDDVKEVPGEILMDWRISSFRILQFGSEEQLTI